MTKLEKILCPTDFSRESDEALRYAVALAREFAAELFVCNCLPETAAAGLSAEAAAKLFENVVAPHLGARGDAGLRWRGLTLTGEDPGQLIAGEAAALGADLIVMRSRRGPTAAALLGSTAETVCRTAPCSVLVTRARGREWVGYSAGDVGLSRVLVAYDFSDRSELALQQGYDFARKFGAELRLVHVLPAPERDAPELAWEPGASRVTYHEALRRLRQVTPYEDEDGCVVKPVVLTGKPYERVLSYAAEEDVDLICLGADGVGKGLHALFGSNSDRVLRQAPCPVLVARAYKPAPQASVMTRA
jgi:nucleotide-binding universal stress UspA family protein